MARPLIAIVGALDEMRGELELRNVPQAIAAAAQLGRALAEAGCDIVVYSSDAIYLEPHVVRGFASSDRAEPGTIHVVYPLRGPTPVFAEQQAKPGCFTFQMSQYRSWEVSFYRSLHAVDGLVLIGGGRSTFIAGVLATTRQMPLVALEAYGGQATRVWELIDPGEGLIHPHERAQMAEETPSESWAAAIVKLLLAQRQRLHERDRQQLRQTRAYRWTIAGEALVGLALLAAALALVIWTWDAPLIRPLLLSALVTAPMLAGASASLVRSLWESLTTDRSERPRAIWPMAALGCTAGAIAGLLYVVAQLTAVVPSADGRLPISAGRIVPFALLTGFLTGFATDAFFRRMAERDPGEIRLPPVPVRLT